MIEAITQAPQSVSYRVDGRASAGTCRARSSKNPDVQSLTSFIGVDGSNITLNSGRMLINLKPRDDRSSTASEVIRQLQQRRRAYRRASLYMQPVQDLTIDSTVSPHAVSVHARRTRTSSEFDNAGPQARRAGCKRVARTRRCRHRPAGQRPVGVCRDRPRDRRRVTASRPATVDSALYDAFGQRIVSTIFTAVEPVPRDPGSAARRCSTTPSR